MVVLSVYEWLHKQEFLFPLFDYPRVFGIWQLVEVGKRWVSLTFVVVCGCHMRVYYGSRQWNIIIHLFSSILGDIKVQLYHRVSKE